MSIDRPEPEPAGQQHAARRAKRGRGLQHDGQPDIGQARVQERRSASARTGDHGNDAGADRDMDIDAHEDGEDAAR